MYACMLIIKAKEICKKKTYKAWDTIVFIYSLIIHSSKNLFSQHSRQFILSFSQAFEKLFFTVLTWQNHLLFSQSFRLTNTRQLLRRGTYEGCDLVPLVTSSVGDSELIIHFQEAYARLLSNCYFTQGIQSNLASYRLYMLKSLFYQRKIILIKKRNVQCVLKDNA